MLLGDISAAVYHVLSLLLLHSSTCILCSLSRLLLPSKNSSMHNTVQSIEGLNDPSSPLRAIHQYTEWTIRPKREAWHVPRNILCGIYPPGVNVNFCKTLGDLVRIYKVPNALFVSPARGQQQRPEKYTYRPVSYRRMYASYYGICTYRYSTPAHFRRAVCATHFLAMSGPNSICERSRSERVLKSQCKYQTKLQRHPTSEINTAGKQQEQYMDTAAGYRGCCCCMYIQVFQYLYCCTYAVLEVVNSNTILTKWGTVPLFLGHF